MITEIYIENYKLDVSADLDALLTFAIDDVKDFASRNTSFSKTITLPGTARNNAVFGNVFDIIQSGQYDSTQANVNFNYNVAKSASCIIFQGNIQIFKGVIRIMEIILDNESIEYDCAVFGELGGFISKMGALKLEDLDFSAYDHNWSIANIVGSWENASAGQGYYYPLIDYGTYSDDKHDWQYGTFKPALFAKEYIDKIFAKAGYSYNCALFNTSRFKSLIIPQNKKTLFKSTSFLINANNTADYTLINLNDTDRENVTFNTLTLGNFTQAAGVFTYTGANPITATLNFSIYGYANLHFNTGTTHNYSIIVTIYKNTTIIDRKTYSYGGYKDISLPYRYTYTGDVSFATNDELSVEVHIVIPSSNGTYYNSNVTAFNNTYLTLIASSNVLAPANYGDTLNMNSNLPSNILQKDFIASMIKMFNLYIFEDKFNQNVLNISPYVDFFDANPLNAIDWTYKLDRSKPISIKPMSELTSRYYEFKFKEDTDYWNDLYKKRYNLPYGSYLFDTQFEFANASNTVELIFSPTPLVGYLNEDKVYSTIYKRTDSNISHATDGGAFVTGKVEEKIDSNIRILIAKKVTGVASWNIIESNGNVLGTYTNYPYAGHFDDPDAPANDLNFSIPKELFFTITSGAFNVNQFNVYWLPYMYEIIDQDSRLLTATFRLNEQDINLLDFSKLIYVDGSLFRLNRIVDYNAATRDVCKVELLKVINTKY
jgi:hypothetical protein